MSDIVEGCVHLFQEQKPTKFIGSLAGWVQESKPGWVVFVFFQEPGLIEVKNSADGFKLDLELDLALRMSSLLLCLSQQNIKIREIKKLFYEINNNIDLCKYYKITSFMIENVTTISILFIGNSDFFQLKFEDDQVRITIRDDVSKAIGLSISKYVGDLFAEQSIKMTNDLEIREHMEKEIKK